MKNKVLFFRGQNATEEMQENINQAIAKANKDGWRVVLVKTAAVPFGERFSEDFGKMPLHMFFTVTILFEK